MNPAELAQSQALPLELKIIKSQQRIREWYEHWRGQVYVSFSGGKDSTVLLRLVREIYPDVPAVFCDTGLEYPEVRQFALSVDNVKVLKPVKDFYSVIREEGYPILSKRTAQAIREYRTTKSDTFRAKILNGYTLPNGDISRRFSIPFKWLYLINAPFLISDKCCEYMKKRPFRAFEKENDLIPMTGEIATDGEQRLRNYLNTGCNAFNAKRPKSMPLGFWTEQDILQYLKNTGIPYSPIYGDIREHEGRLYMTGDRRTGCAFCMFGVHMKHGENRFMRMYRTHPKLWDYCIHKLGCGYVLNYIGVPYRGLF
jgi:3'-phosphoadenosine 5'-phosphosulfate sulfotransferase (PAPS reductase)/FAD synthetase